jgi:hypothetical protein
MRFGRLFIAGMAAVGVVTGLLTARLPWLAEYGVAVLAVPLAASLLVDLVTLPMVQRGRLAPLTMEQRFIGVIGAALLALAVQHLAGRAVA